MSILQARERQVFNAGRGASRIRRILAQTFRQMEASLNQVCQVCERHGRQEIKEALGGDNKEVVELYMTLKDAIEKHKSDGNIPNLPT